MIRKAGKKVQDADIEEMGYLYENIEEMGYLYENIEEMGTIKDNYRRNEGTFMGLFTELEKNIKKHLIYIGEKYRRNRAPIPKRSKYRRFEGYSSIISKIWGNFTGICQKDPRYRRNGYPFL